MADGMGWVHCNTCKAPYECSRDGGRERTADGIGCSAAVGPSTALSLHVGTRDDVGCTHAAAAVLLTALGNGLKARRFIHHLRSATSAFLTCFLNGWATCASAT